MTATDTDTSEIRTGTAAAAGGGQEVPRQGSPDFHLVLREQITGLLERWQRLSAKYGELGSGHERGGSVATAGLMSMGALVYDTCAQDLVGLLIGLDRRFSGEDGLYSLEDSDPDREGAA
jgi:hypothetical protein